MKAAALISTIEHLMAQELGPSAQVAERALLIEHELLSIVVLVDCALAALADSDAARADLEEIRLAAQLAIAKLTGLAAPRPRLIAV